jgi:hypothetical protein
MERLLYTVWLARQAISALLYFWPVTLTLAAAFILTLALRSPLVGSESQLRRRHLLLLSPLAVTLLILCWGAAMQHPSTSQTLAPSWPSHVVLALLVLQFLVSIWVVWAMKDYRWFSASTVALEQWFGLACAFVAGMSVTGDWL